MQNEKHRAKVDFKFINTAAFLTKPDKQTTNKQNIYNDWIKIRLLYIKNAPEILSEAL